MNPLAELPTWVAILVALFAAIVLVVLNLGWLMAAKSMLDAQRQKNRELRSATPTPAVPDAQRVVRDEPSERPDRTPII